MLGLVGSSRGETLWRLGLVALLALLVDLGHARWSPQEGPLDAGAPLGGAAVTGQAPAAGEGALLSEDEASRAVDGRLRRDGGLSTIERTSRRRAEAEAVAAESSVAMAPANSAPADSAPRAVELGRSAFERQLEGYGAGAGGGPVAQFGHEVFAGASLEDVDRAVGADYVIGNGDELVVSVWGSVIDQDFRVVVDREGRGRLAQIGLVALKGLTVEGAEAALREEFGRLYKNFELRVRVAGVRDMAVHVVGRVVRPGRLRVSSLSTLLDALSKAGGVTKDGSLRSITLRRRGEEDRRVDLYDYLLEGDVSVDVSLAAGDVVVVPPVGPRVAIVGQVLRPAIYEIAADQVSLADLLAMAGGWARLADRSRIQIESATPERSGGPGLRARTVDLDTTPAAEVALADGEVVIVREGNPVLDDVVYVVGNVARPGRYAIRPGARVSDVITQDALVAAGFWLDRRLPDSAEREGRRVLGSTPARDASIDSPQSDGTELVADERRAGATADGRPSEDPVLEYPEPFLDYALIRRIDPATRRESRIAFDLGKALLDGEPRENIELRSQDTIVIFPRASFDLGRTVFVTGAVQKPGEQRFFDGMRVHDLIRMSGGLLPEAFRGEATLTRIHPEQSGARFEHLAIDLSKALDGDPAHDLELEKDDSLAVSTVPDYRAAWRVTLEGEVRKPGTYTVIPGERLSAVIERAGGYTADAYLPAARFFRESVRRLQDERLAESLRRLEREAQLAAQRYAAEAEAIDEQTSVEEEQRRVSRLIDTLREVRAQGRMVIRLDPIATLRGSEHDIELADGDRLIVPRRPTEVHVLGAVFNQNALLFKAGLRAADYLRECGGATDSADLDIAYVIRADGTADSARDARGGYRWDAERGRFSRGDLLSEALWPGDTLVVPYDVSPQLSALGLTKTITQILFNVAFATGIVIAAL